ncbi:MAG TPA: hypothetical protein VH500_19495 [Nitrososphaeraceae archaeon]|jgi:hypothetical protein
MDGHSNQLVLKDCHLQFFTLDLLLVKFLKNTNQLVSHLLIRQENNSDLSKSINGPNRDKALEHT